MTSFDLQFNASILKTQVQKPKTLMISFIEIYAVHSETATFTIKQQPENIL